ncbi:hypothetical protein [Streptomyces vinaceus]|uniref:hypothetical protein n=1 Tax=Streptomyces vinaceus TaxID=1960 RepID=UPI0035DE6515
MSMFSDRPVRYRSEGGAIITADIWKAKCGGCDAETYSVDRLKWAQAHAEKCRALPRH